MTDHAHCMDCEAPLSPTRLDALEGHTGSCDECYVPPEVRPCELCGVPTYHAPAFGYLCVGCCFADNH